MFRELGNSHIREFYLGVAYLLIYADSLISLK